MADVRRTARGIQPIVACGDCTWQLWRANGFTRKQAYEAVKRHHYNECPGELWARFRAAYGAES